MSTTSDRVQSAALAGAGQSPASALPRPSILLLAALLLLAAAALRLGTTPRAPAPEDLPIAGGGQPTATDAALTAALAEITRGRADSTAFATLGALYLQKARESADPGHYARAEQAFQRALAADRNDASALAGLGGLALARHQFREALDWGARAQAGAPYSAAPWGVLGDAHLELGQYDQAFEAFQRMVDRRPDLSSYTRASYARELTGDRAAAIELMARAAQAGAPTGENTAWALVQLGNLRLDGGDLAAAEATYRQALTGYPGHPAAVAGLARVRAARGDLAGAAALYERVVTVVPLPEHAIALGELYQALGRPAEAERQWALVGAIDRLLTAAGVDTDVEMVLFAADRGQDPAATVARARAARERRPSIKGDEALGWALRAAGDCAAALPYARASLRLGTREPVLLYRAGAVAACAGERAEA
ncbi:MAG TPA: tetratricopeptide repeat protein, partial [Chloroflexota bacterium]